MLVSVMLVQMNSYQTDRDGDVVLQLLFALDYLTVCSLSLAAHRHFSFMELDDWCEHLNNWHKNIFM